MGKVRIYTFLSENLKSRSMRYLHILRNNPLRILIPIYLFLSLILARSHIFNNDSLLVTLFILPTVILIPLLVGKLALTIVLGKQNQNSIVLNPLSFMIIAWITGLLIIFLTASMLFTVRMFSSNFYSSVIFFVSIAASSLQKNGTFTQLLKKKTFNDIFGDAKLLFVVALVGVLPLLYVIPRSPFPSSFNSTYVWYLSALEFRDANYIELAGGNTPVVSTFFGVLSTIYQVHPLSIYSGTNYLAHILYPIFIYALCYRLTKRIEISLFSSLIAPWVYEGITLMVLEERSLNFMIFPLLLYLTFDYLERQPTNPKQFVFKRLTLAFTFLVPILILLSLGPKTPPLLRVLVLVFFPTYLICGTYFIRDKNRKLFFLFFILPLIEIGIIHLFELLFIFIFLSSFALSKVLIEKNRLAFVKIGAFTFFVFVHILVSNIIPLSFLDNFMLTRWRFGSLFDGFHPFDLNPAQRYELLAYLGPPLVFAILIVSIPVTILLSKSKDERNGIVPFTFMCSFITLVTFLPDGLLGWRATMYWNVPYAIMCSLILFLLFDNFIKLFKKGCKILHLGHKMYFIKVAYFLLLILLLFPFFQSSRINYLNNFARANPSGYLSYIQPYEVNAAFWIYKNTTNNTVLVSDPHTMLILKCLTTRDTLLGEYLYTFDKEYSNETISRMNLLREKVFMATSSARFYSEIRKISSDYGENKQILIIVSLRTLTWIKTGEMFPVDIEKAKIKEFSDAVFDNELFSLVFYDAGMELYIYKLT